MNPTTHPAHQLNIDTSIENSSDSDWLDIASGHDSDNDSTSLFSDRNGISSLPLSRRSSMSLGSSREGEVEAWEGFVSDSSEDDFAGLDNPARTGTVRRAGGVSVHPTNDSSVPEAPASPVDPQEEQRVKLALDQSFVSTLSSSRSPPGTVQNSVQNLRLSFPDPLTSSDTSLRKSFEAVSVPRMSPSPTPEIEEDESHAVATEPSAVVSDGRDELAGDNTIVEETTPDRVPEFPQAENQIDEDPDLDVYLYGASPLLKRLLVRELLAKASTEEVIDNVTPSARTFSMHDHTMHTGAPMVCSSAPFVITPFTSFQPSTRVASGRPSLAVVFLPCEALYAQQLPEHTMYLPVSSSAIGTGILSKMMPIHKVMRFGGDFVTRAIDLENLSEKTVKSAVSEIFTPARPLLKKRSSFGTLRPNKNAVTLYVIS
jgi:hypothetical protein